jgi:hypothetical protein
MPTILEIQIGLHCLQSEDNYIDLYKRDFPLSHQKQRKLNIDNAINNLLRNGLIEEHGNGYRKSDALHHWIKALEAVPFPVIE